MTVSPTARRGKIEVGGSADLLLFDPATVGSSEPKMVADLPGGASRLIRDAVGVHGVWVNGVRVVGGGAPVSSSAPGQVIRSFDPMRPATQAS